MTYTPTNWQTGDVVTADKLNKLENGVEKSVVTDAVVHITFDSWENLAEGIADIAPSQLLPLIYDQANQVYNKSAMAVLTFLSDISTEPALTFLATLQDYGYTGGNITTIDFQTAFISSTFQYPVYVSRIKVTGDTNSNKWLLETDEIALQLAEEGE